VRKAKARSGVHYGVHHDGPRNCFGSCGACVKPARMRHAPSSAPSRDRISRSRSTAGSRRSPRDDRPGPRSIPSSRARTCRARVLTIRAPARAAWAMTASTFSRRPTLLPRVGSVGLRPDSGSAVSYAMPCAPKREPHTRLQLEEGNRVPSVRCLHATRERTLALTQTIGTKRPVRDAPRDSPPIFRPAQIIRRGDAV
jgi:hypothetical protein